MKCLHPWLNKPCQYCQFYVTLGTIVSFQNNLIVLDAVAELLRQHAVTRRAHARELREEAAEAGRAARDSYAQGRQDALEPGEW